MAEGRSFSRAGVALALVVQMGCSDDVPPWDVPGSDGGLDGSVTGAREVSSGTHSDADTKTSTSAETEPATLTVQIDASAQPWEDASVESVDTASSGFSTSRTSDETVGSAPTLETSDISTDTTVTGYSSIPSISSSDEPSETSSEASSSDWLESTEPPASASDAGPDAGPRFASCAEQCSAECFPDCIRDLIAPCQPAGACSADDTTYCWQNGVRLIEEGDAFTDYSRVVYGPEDSVCYSAESSANPIAGSGSYTWRDANGTIVAEGVWDFGSTVVVTCVESGSVWDFEFPDPYYGCGAIDVYGWSIETCEPGACVVNDAQVPLFAR